MKLKRIIEILSLNQTTQHHIPENYNLYADHCKDLKFKKCCDYLNMGMNNSNETGKLVEQRM